MRCITAKQTEMLQRLIRFAGVGCLGFAVDCCVFWLLLHGAGLTLLPARIFAFIAAATTTWLGNRYLTFAVGSSGDKLAQWRKSMCVACISLLPNLLVFHVFTSLLPPHPLGIMLGFVAGIAAGLLSNFYLSCRWVFAPKGTSVCQVDS